MPQNRTEQTSILRLSSLVLGCAALLLASAAEAQTVRPSNTVYLSLRGGTTVYGGELDQTGSGGAREGDGASSWAYQDFGWLAGAELGYQFTPSLGFGLGFNYGAYANLDEARDAGNNPPAIPSVLNDDKVPSLVAAFRYMPFPGAKLSPYTNLGAQITFASDNGSGRETGYGPLLGLGLDFALSQRLSLFAEGNMGFIFPDIAIDGFDPGGNRGAGAQGDDTEFDNIGFYGAGLRFNFGTGATRADIESLQCPSEVVAGETASFMMMARENATEPVAYAWQWGDGATGTGMSASHAFRTPGTYTVTASTSNAGGQDSESCLVTVTAPPPPAVAISACRATPATAAIGSEVTFNATVANAASVAITYGDGSRGTALPARHSYASAGTYRATITATGAGGDTRSCEVTVTVVDTFCANITELNPSYFGFGAATLTADAISRLNENLEILRRCPATVVTVNGYTDDRESDQTRLSQRRADAVRDYYIAQGIDASRVRAIGRGQDPNANSKEDPGPGDSRARRADSIPSNGF
jgi:outer membrane protein OmpA-like peptidoglycan-associated protein